MSDKTKKKPGGARILTPRILELRKEVEDLKDRISKIEAILLEKVVNKL